MSGINHAFSSSKSASSDTTLVDGPKWNADHTINGDVAFGGHKATGLSDPSSAQDAATKAYVDASSGGGGVFAAIFGHGRDGDLVFDGTSTVLGLVPTAGVYTATRDLFPHNMTVNTGVKVQMNGLHIYGTGTLDVVDPGGVNDDGADGSNVTGPASARAETFYAGGQGGGTRGNGSAGGAASASNPCPSTWTAASGAASGTNGAVPGAGGGGGGGGGNAGGPGGAITIAIPAAGGYDWHQAKIGGSTDPQTSIGGRMQYGSGGGGGGGSSFGGYGGAGGGIVFVAFHTLKSTGGAGTLRARGGAGSAAQGGNSGGGAGGGGGQIVVIYATNTQGGDSLGFNVDGGIGGTPTGTGSTSGNGHAGLIDLYNISGDGT